MKVLYDYQTFSLQDYGGISRIYTELLKHSSDYEVKAQLSILLSNNAYLNELDQIKNYRFFPSTQSYYKTQFMMNVNKLHTILKLKSAEFDVFHPTYYDPYFLKHLKGRPFVVTFFDLIHEKFGKQYSQLGDDKFMFKRKQSMLEKAAKVIAISSCTKKDIVEIFGTDEGKIEVIYLGNSLTPPSDNKISRIVPSDYLLFIGVRGTYKNFQFFLNSCRDTLLSNKGLELICAGGGRFVKEELDLIDKLELNNKINYVPISNDNTLVSLYFYAKCFIFPSLYEGFGIPVLEAFSCGCPIVLSDRGSLSEVGGEAVLYCNPEDSESISSKVNAYLNDSSLRAMKAEQGLERLKLFSWAKTSNETFNLYKSLV